MALFVTNAGTGKGIAITQTGNGIALQVSSEATSYDRYALYVASEADGGAVTARLLYKKTTGSNDCVQIENDGTGYALNCRQDGVGVALLVDQNADEKAILVETNAGSDTSYGLKIHSHSGATAAYFLFDDVGDSGNAVVIENKGDGKGLYINNTGDGTCLDISQTGDAKCIYANSSAPEAATNHYVMYLKGTGGAGIAFFYNEHTTTEKNVVDIRNDGDGMALTVFNKDSGNHAVKIYGDTNSYATGKHGLYINVDYNDTGSTEWAVCIECTNGGTGGKSAGIDVSSLLMADPAFKLKVNTNISDVTGGEYVTVHDSSGTVKYIQLYTENE